MKTLIYIFSIALFTSCSEDVDIIEIEKPIAVVCDSTEYWNDYWKNYEMRANCYLSRRRFKGTKMTGALLKNAAKMAKDTFDCLIPVEFALSQAQWESGMGLAGRSPINNPFNLGEYSNKTVLRYNSPKAGIDAYYSLIARRYLKGRYLQDLFNKYEDIDGHGYAASPIYGKKIESQYYYIKKWIDNNLDK